MNQLNYLNKPFFDHGALEKISEVLRDLGLKKPLICTDPGLSEIGMLDKLRSLISNEFTPIIFSKTPANPTQEAVELAVETYKNESCDGVIGFGGGSSIDLGKAVSIMVTHEGHILDYSINEGGLEKINKTSPLIAIPTTSGTGSEVSSGAVIIMNDGRKLILASSNLIPDAAICDPDLTLGLPPSMTSGAGMDALTHCVEAVLSPVIDPPAEAVGLDGIERIFKNENLIKAVKEGFEKATFGNTKPLQDRINKFIGFFSEPIVRNDIFDLVYIKDVGVKAYKNDKELGLIEGRDFKYALFKIWLGDEPASESLKNGMLGLQ